MKILIGYDGSGWADQAIWDLKKAGLPKTAQVLVLTAADVFLPEKREVPVSPLLRAVVEKSREASLEKLAEAKLLATRAEFKLKALFPHWSIQTKSMAESPAWALIEKAEEWKPDIVLLGAHGHSKLGRFLGSVSQMVVNQSNRTVRIGRGGSKASEKGIRVLVGLDGSQSSIEVMARVKTRNWPTNTKFLLLAVVDPQKSTLLERHSPSILKWFFDQGDDTTAVLGRMLDSFAAPLREQGFSVACEVLKGDPKTLLVKEAKKWGADSIFVGARGLTYVKRLLIGGVSSAVASRAPCSVEVVR